MARRGKGFLEARGDITVLHLKGAPYERGSQHGALLADRITATVCRGLTGAAAVTALALGCSVEQAMDRLRRGKEEASGFLPPEIEEEMHGIADALKEAGSPLSFDDVLLWNTMYDSWCFFAHPDPSDPAAMYRREPYTIGCSSFSAWGTATSDGKLLFAKNMDNLDLPGILEGRVLMISDPEQGHGHVNMVHPGMLAIDGGFNEDGIEMMTHYSPSVHETMRGCGIGTLSRLILQRASNVEDAAGILSDFPRCTGINYHVADAKTNTAVVVECSARDTAVRHPFEKDVLWSTNHYNCYPGWRGYEGLNMVESQQPVFRLRDISSIPAWQESLRDTSNAQIDAPGRFRRLEKLLDEHYGALDPTTAMEILRDRHHPDTGELRPWDVPARGRNDGVTISFFLARKTFCEQAQFYKSSETGRITGQTGNLWAMVATPGSGDFHVAMSDFPAHRGAFTHFNLREELGR
jgi:predicted choloylglycine hydrolase